MEPNRNPKGPLYIIGGVVLLGIILSLVLLKKQNGPENQTPAPIESVVPSGTPAPETSAEASADASASPVDLTTDAEGLSKSVVTITTEKGKIEFKFYPKDAPNTVNRIVELIQKGFYNGLTFHRVVPGFVIQGGRSGRRRNGRKRSKVESRI